VFSGDESKAIELDFSPADMYVDSNGKTGKDFGYVAQKQAYKKPLKKLQRQPARKQAGSANREKARVKVARIESHIANSRLDFIEKETLRLVRTHEVIGIEDLNLIGISKFLANSKNMTDTSWGIFVGKLIRKASKNEHNCQVVKVDRYFPSSQICSCCEHRKTDLKLSDRIWKCRLVGRNAFGIITPLLI
jgi:putative transposase